MPNRMLRDTIRSSDSLGRVSAEVERFFYRLLMTVDDYGRFDGRLSVIKAETFKFHLEDISLEEITDWLSQLVQVGIIELYVTDGKEYGRYINWEKYQRIRAKESKFPPPIADANICKQMSADANICKQMSADANICKQMQTYVAVVVDEVVNEVVDEVVNEDEVVDEVEDVDEDIDEDVNEVVDEVEDVDDTTDESEGNGFLVPEIPTDGIKASYVAELEKLKTFRRLKAGHKQRLAWIALETDERTKLLKLDSVGVEVLDEAKKFVDHWSVKSRDGPSNPLLAWRNWLYGPNGAVVRAIKQYGGSNGVARHDLAKGSQSEEDKWERDMREHEERKAKLRDRS